jgi:hypothetical protein
MPIPLGEDAIINVGVTTGPTTPVYGINSYTAPRTRPETVRKYFMMAAQTFVGSSEDSVQLQGDYNQADPGQDILRAAYIAGTTVFVEILPDGTNGFEQECRVSQAELSGPSPDDPPGTTFQLVGADDPTDVGTGL